jgi:hypothetical protein
MPQGLERIKGNHQAKGPKQGHKPSLTTLVFSALPHGTVNRKDDKQKQALQGPNP